MVPPGLTQQQIATFRHVFDALFEFLRWTYGVAIGGLDRTVLQNRILHGWAHPDGSTRELLAYLGGLHTTIYGEPPARRDRYRPEVRRILASVFAAHDPTERGQVLALLHRTLELASPGCTGAAPPPAYGAPPVVPAVPGAHPGAHPGPRGTTPGSMSPVPGTHVAHGGASPSRAYGMPPAPAAAPHGPAYPPAPPTAAGPGGWPPVAGAPVDPDLPIDVQRVRDETARYQALLMDQKIWEMRSNLATQVIQSMGR
jgi:hypothetical protein